MRALPLLLLAACVADVGTLAGVGTISTIAGNGESGLGTEGRLATETSIYLPQDLTFGPDGLPYLLDWNNHRILVVDEDGTLRVIAGNGTIGDAGEGDARESGLNHPSHLAFDGHQRMIVSLWHNSKVGAVDLSSGRLTILCGTGRRAFNGDGLHALETDFDLPVSTAFDQAGRMLVMDQANQRIRRVGNDGIVETIVGPAEMQQLYGAAAPPSGRMELHDGILYFVDVGNHRVRAVDLEQREPIVWTVAGEIFQRPADVAVDEEGAIYVADTDNSCIRKIELDGTIYPVAGRCGERGFEGDGGPAHEALLDRPFGVALDRNGDLYVADTLNHRIRKVSF
jgi:hypothetical protein